MRISNEKKIAVVTLREVYFSKSALSLYCQVRLGKWEIPKHKALREGEICKRGKKLVKEENRLTPD